MITKKTETKIVKKEKIVSAGVKKTVKPKEKEQVIPEIEETKEDKKTIEAIPEALSFTQATAAEEEIVFDTKKKYFEAVGRRKNATARVRLFTQNKKGIEVNGKPYQDYFKTSSLQKMVVSPLEKLKCEDKFGFVVKVKGGGISGQAGAVRHAIARTLILLNPYFKKRLKKSGYLTRDSRMRERKKFGLKRARRAPQWSKR